MLMFYWWGTQEVNRKINYSIKQQYKIYNLTKVKAFQNKLFVQIKLKLKTKFYNKCSTSFIQAIISLLTKANMLNLKLTDINGNL